MEGETVAVDYISSKSEVVVDYMEKILYLLWFCGSQEVASNIIVFCAKVFHEIVCKVNGTLIVT